MTTEELVDKHYDEMFDKLCNDGVGDFGLDIQVTILADGKTIRRSWSDRNKMLREEGK